MTTEPLTGTLHRRCMYCEQDMGTRPCIARMDGHTTHGVCEACRPLLRAQLGLDPESTTVPK